MAARLFPSLNNLTDRGRHTGASTFVAVLMIAAGTLLRLPTPNTIEFKADEVAALTLGMQLIDDHPWSSSAPWPQHGIPSSLGIANPPLFNWVMALFWGLTHSAVGATMCVALINAAALIPFWLWARHWFGEPRALLAVSAMALSPFAVILSRKIWPVDLLFPSLLLVLQGIAWLRSDKPWRGIVTIALAALIVGQLHMSGPIAFALLPIAFVIQEVVDRRRGRTPFRLGRPSTWEAAALVIVLGLHVFFWFPYLVYLSGLSNLLSQRKTVPCCSPDLLRELLRQLVPRGLLYFVDGEDFLKEPVFRAFYYAAIAFGVPVSVYGIWRWFRSPFSVPVLGIWWLLIVATFALAHIYTPQYYVLILSPLPALLIAGVFDRPTMSRRFARALMGIRWAYVASLAGLSISALTWVAARGGAPTDYGVAYSVREAQAKAALSLVSTTDQATPAALDPTLRCYGVPWSVIWIAQQIDDERGSQLQQRVRICDDWRQENGRIHYRWAVARQGND
jgi:hypothetical protein